MEKPLQLESGLCFDTSNYQTLLCGLKKPPVLVNDLDIRYPEDLEILNKYLLTTYESATFSMIPSCDCGQLMGGYLRGKTCPHCQSEVLSHTEVPIESNLWINVPEGVHAFITPIAYHKLKLAFDSGNIDVLRWLTDIHYKGNFNENDVIVKLRERGVKRGYNNFIEHFWEYIDILLERKMYSSVNGERKTIKQWLLDHKDDLFTPVIGLPNRIALVVEKVPTGRFSEVEKYGGVVEAALAIASLKTRIDPPTQLIRESAAVKCVQLLSNYYSSQYKNSLGQKEGLIRKQICGSRMPFTGRNVISSIHDVHEYDELHIPWGQAIGLLEIHLFNKFLRDGYTPNEAMQEIRTSVNCFNPRIRHYFDELLAESPYKGLPCCFNRNPTLLRGSIQQLYITKIKNHVNDITISLSCLILSLFNASKNWPHL